MKSKQFVFRDLEWWVITLVFLVTVLANVLHSPPMHSSAYFAYILIPVIYYLGFYLIHMKVIPQYLKDRKIRFLILYMLLISAATCLLGALFASEARMGGERYVRFFLNTVALYAGYLISAILVRKILLPPKLQDYQLYNGTRLCLIYIFTIVFLLQGSQVFNEFVAFFFGIFVPAVFVVVVYNYLLVYGNRKRGKVEASNWLAGLLAVLIIVVCGVISIGTRQAFVLLFGLGGLTLVFLVIFPISNLIFGKYDSYVGQMQNLSYQVNQGSARLDFLRSQINPHFLFNALNTLYGSALMENAEKTSDGIQKLGDMMRFMLHENQRDRIPLSREINYMRNYLDLQMLRFGKEEQLEVTINLTEDTCQGDIAPMLLIPFVENAFKHGISTKNKSWIKINLRCLQGSVHLDVVNSIHPKKATEDPKDESGIGMENVRRRLELLYPSRHTLTVVSNDTEHFVHLSVQL